MCTGNTWPYWIELGVATVLAGLTLVVAKGSRDPTRQVKTLIAFAMYAAVAVVAGALALQQGQWARSGDGVCVIWGRWALAIPVHAAVAALISLSLSPSMIDLGLAVIFGGGSATALLFGTLTSSQNGGNAESAAILWTVASGFCVIALGLLLAGIALGMRRFILFPSAYQSTDGRANVINRWWYIALVVGTFLVYAGYTLLYALGPEGWREYSKQFTQTMLLTIALDMLLLVFIAAPVLFLLNPDGAPSTATAYEALSPAETATAAPAGQQVLSLASQIML